MTPDYDRTVAELACSIARSLILNPDFDDPEQVARRAVRCARAIVAEVKRTEPPPPADV